MNITPEMARAELERRESSNTGSSITPEMAREELARRRMATQEKQPDVEKKNPSIMDFVSSGKSLGDVTGTPGKDTLPALAVGTGRGFMDVGQGAKQIALQLAEKAGFAKPGTSDDYRKKVNEELRVYESIPEIKNSPLAAGAGRIVGSTAATAPLGAVVAPARLGMIAQRVATGTAQGAGAGFLQYDPTGDSRLQNTAIGAVTGGVIPAAGAGIGRVIKGKTTPESMAKTQELGRLSKELGVDLTVPELRGSVGGKYAESVIDKVPGTGYIGFREKQTGQLKNAAENIIDKVGGNSTKDAGQTLLNSLESRLITAKKIASKKADKVEKIAEQQGGKVQFNNLKNEATTILSELEQIPPQFRNNELIDTVKSYLTLDNQSFGIARKLRSQLSDEVKRLKNAANSGSVPAQAYRDTTRLVKSLEKDIDEFGVKSGGALKQAYQEFNKFYKDKVVPFKSDELAKAIGGDYDKDQVIGAFLKPGREELASTLINNTGKKGLQAARAAVLNNAMEKASQGEFFNAQTFAKEALRLGKANNVLFSDPQRKSLEGFSKLSKAAERASKFAANPETGARLTGPIGAITAVGATYANPLFGLGIAGGIGMAKLMHSEMGRRLLTRAYNLPEKDTKAWNKLLTDVAKLTAPVAATKSNTNNLPEQENQS